MSKSTTWIALLRGINVGGNNIVPMAELKKELTALKFENVQTYIQSGNVVFSATSSSSSALAKRISQQIKKSFGFQPHLFVLTLSDLEKVIKANPYPHAESSPSTLHFFFLAEPARKPDVAAMQEIKASSENFTITKKVFYLHAPDGIGRSKLAAKAEKLLGVATTARNFRTIDKLVSMVRR